MKIRIKKVFLKQKNILLCLWETKERIALTFLAKSSACKDTPLNFYFEGYSCQLQIQSLFQSFVVHGMSKTYIQKQGKKKLGIYIMQMKGNLHNKLAESWKKISYLKTQIVILWNCI